MRPEFCPALAERAARGRERRVVAEGFGWPPAARPHGDHEGLAGDGVVAVRGLRSRRPPDPHRCRDQRKARQACRLKENVIIGKLILGRYRYQPVYRNIQVQPTEVMPSRPLYALPSYDDGYYSPDARHGTGAGGAAGRLRLPGATSGNVVRRPGS
ncbi:hypothetical protein HBB16_06830 [Pseudonocardia sp. MCCB 268]|nr:hypothetical protein [Pseudonocardia cytotoxica]